MRHNALSLSSTDLSDLKLKIPISDPHTHTHTHTHTHRQTSRLKHRDLRRRLTWRNRKIDWEEIGDPKVNFWKWEFFFSCFQKIKKIKTKKSFYGKLPRASAWPKNTNQMKPLPLTYIRNQNVLVISSNATSKTLVSTKRTSTLPCCLAKHE